MSLKNVVLASHGELSKGMLDSLRLITGENSVKYVRTYSLLPGESAIDFAKLLEEEIVQHPEHEYIIISDVFGGSVHGALMQILQHDNMMLFTGMNMPLVLEIVTQQGTVNEEKATHICKNASSGIQFYTKESMRMTCEKEDF